MTNEELDERLQIIELQLKALTSMLTEDSQFELEREIVDVKERAWERRMRE